MKPLHPGRQDYDPNDEFWLARSYFMQQKYSRAECLLTRPFPTSSPKHPSTPPVNLTNGGKGRKRETLLAIPRLSLGLSE
ncbi:hypothetical protein D9757_007955 [Collybiopsis confluens]|uniref:Uncharacterized protein n=1 Tax=Collybiopsis confluens TaxID=2823264 RepID=A0A8H5M4D4_9AGAR|nr:hypothetical protein D9757_007955 [Collybiopsis confluens]